MRLVQVFDPKSTMVHLQDEDVRTRCKRDPVRAVYGVVDRSQMCIMCFGNDRGKSQWTAQRLGIERINEGK